MTDLAPRATTALDDVAEGWLNTQLDLRPELRVRLGVDGDRSSFTDWSPDGASTRAEAARRTLSRARAAEPCDAVDVATKAELVRVLELEVEQYESGLWRRDLNVIDSPVQQMREIFDSMPTSTHDDWFAVARRMQRLPEAMRGYLSTLLSGTRAAVTPAARQVRAVSDQAARLARRGGFFEELASHANAPTALASELRVGAAAAAAAFDDLRRFLDNELLPVATPRDAVGRDHYALASRGFVGDEIDTRCRTGRGGRSHHTRRQRRRRHSGTPGRPSLPPRRHGRARVLDAGCQRPSHREPRRVALRHPRAVEDA